MARPPSAKTRRIQVLLERAEIDAGVKNVTDLGIGTAGLAARGMRARTGPTRGCG